MNGEKPEAHAIDLFELNGEGLATWRWKYFEAISHLMTSNMRWGGTFKTLGDADHFELSLGKPPGLSLGPAS